MTEPRDPTTHTEVHRVADPEATRVASYLAQPGEVGRVLLLYSGGLDTSVMLKWIQDEYEAEVVALTVNLGQPGEDYDVVRGKALDLGAIAGSKLRLVLNHANAKVKLDVKEIERVLGLSANFPVPDDLAVPMSVNAGRPVVLGDPKAPVSRALDRIAEALLSTPVPKRASGWRR